MEGPSRAGVMLSRVMFSGTWRQTPSGRTNDSTLELAVNNFGSATTYPMLQPCSLGSNKLFFTQFRGLVLPCRCFSHRERSVGALAVFMFIFF